MSRALAFSILGTLMLVSCIIARESSFNEKTVINLIVYYESMCKDSMKFITTQLAPNYNDFKDFLNIEFVPFGKASWKLDENNDLEFTCQHGPQECDGNRAQACALFEIEQTLVPEIQQKKSVKFVKCVMSKQHPPNAVTKCMHKLHFDQNALQRVKNCIISNHGSELLILNGERTNAFESPLKFVPSIQINGRKSPHAFQNLKAVICKNIPKNERPPTCSIPCNKNDANCLKLYQPR